MTFEVNASRNPDDPTVRERPIRPAGHGRVLLADDDAQMRDLVAQTLRADGFDVEEAFDGMDLLAKAGRSLLGRGASEVDLVITDVRMPGFTGLEVLAALRETAPGLPVIVITAFGSPHLHAEAEELGARAVLDKPFELDALRNAVRDLFPPVPR